MMGCLPLIHAQFPLPNLITFAGLIAPQPPADVVAIMEDIYTNPLEYDCGVAIVYGVLFLRYINNPLGPGFSTEGIASYGTSRKVVLKMREATYFSQILATILPTTTFSTAARTVDIATALTLGNNMLNNAGRNAKKVAIVFISKVSSVDPAPIATLMKSKGTEIFVFASSNADYNQALSMASSSGNIFYFTNYCAANHLFKP
ncbi:unnamed protein product [Gordionus sp. m RMFG-2023]